MLIKVNQGFGLLTYNGCECFYDEEENMHCELKENSNPISVSCQKAGGIVLGLQEKKTW